MKRVLILLSIIAAFASTTQAQNSISRSKEVKEQRTVTLYIQLNAIQNPNNNKSKFQVEIGQDFQFYLQDKKMFQVLEDVKNQINTFTTLPDAMNFLSDNGFEMKFHRIRLVLRNDLQI